MQKYKAYNKRAIEAVMSARSCLSGGKVKTAPAVIVPQKPSFWQLEKWPEWWETGAKELEKTAPGRIVTAPVRLPETVITSTRKTVEEVPGVVRTVSRSVPLLAIAGIIIGGGYLVYKFKREKSNSAPSQRMVLSDCRSL